MITDTGFVWRDDPTSNARIYRADPSDFTTSYTSRPYSAYVDWDNLRFMFDEMQNQPLTFTYDHTSTTSNRSTTFYEDAMRAVLQIPHVGVSGTFEFQLQDLSGKEEPMEPPDELLLHLKQYGKEEKPDED